jgi:hypothetical protein
VGELIRKRLRSLRGNCARYRFSFGANSQSSPFQNGDCLVRIRRIVGGELR